MRAFPVPYPRAYLETAQAHVTLDVVAVKGLGHLRQLAPVVAQPNPGYALLLTFDSRCLVVRHSIQIGIRVAPPPRLPRQSSEQLILPLWLRGPKNLDVNFWKTKTNEVLAHLHTRGVCFGCSCLSATRLFPEFSRRHFGEQESVTTSLSDGKK